MTQPLLIVVGGSVGGLSALAAVLAAVPVDFPLPIAVVLHRGSDSGDQLVELLRKKSPLPVVEPEDKEEIVPSRVYVAPADYHLLVERGRFSLSLDEPVACSRPSIDLLFETAAAVSGDRTVGVILTGANADGSRGAAAIRAAGGRIVIQDPATAEARAMPEAAIAAVPGAEILPLDGIATQLVDIAAGSRE